ncbi:hypothetical protein NDU88_001029 [Pleurodeles waltl]|uniref:Uncharacterized protein n=1 Tax=Pleurodeles waltl TaxID=8319 RepID=A0AAV7Q8K8_PLEWA|nr:hypothetical protein NDU88_001029 [Pleurodeles waltl]
MKTVRPGSQGPLPEKVKAKMKPHGVVNSKPEVMALAKYLKQKTQQNVFHSPDAERQAEALGSAMSMNTSTENVKEREGAESTASDSVGVLVSDTNKEHEVVLRNKIPRKVDLYLCRVLMKEI